MECGCEAKQESSSGKNYYEDDVSFCPLHASAPALLEALKAMANLMPIHAGDDVNVLVHKMASDAINQAIGDDHGPSSTTIPTP